jgi:hypothetical protein
VRILCVDGPVGNIAESVDGDGTVVVWIGPGDVFEFVDDNEQLARGIEADDSDAAARLRADAAEALAAFARGDVERLTALVDNGLGVQTADGFEGGFVPELRPVASRRIAPPVRPKAVLRPRGRSPRGRRRRTSRARSPGRQADPEPEPAPSRPARATA